jgi:hypothetical protein
MSAVIRASTTPNPTLTPSKPVKVALIKAPWDVREITDVQRLPGQITGCFNVPEIMVVSRLLWLQAGCADGSIRAVASGQAHLQTTNEYRVAN